MIKKMLFFSSLLSLVFSLVTLLIKQRVSSGGFFSLYSGLSYAAYGWPWWYRQCFDVGGCQFTYLPFILDFVFWFPAAALVYIVVNKIRGLLKEGASIETLHRD